LGVATSEIGLTVITEITLWAVVIIVAASEIVEGVRAAPINVIDVISLLVASIRVAALAVPSSL
jgi:hypothetical protein